MKHWIALSVVLVALFVIAGCTAGPNELEKVTDEEGKVAGFWRGLWHGFIVLFTFIISLFSDNVHVYEVHNNGTWYNLGYLIGILAFFGGSGGGACGRKRK